jgi:hypothetical protein
MSKIYAAKAQGKDGNRRDSASPLLKMPLRVAVCKAPDGGLQAENKKWF